MGWDPAEVDKHWALFLDRDGVINKKRKDDYVRTWEKFEFLPGVLPALKFLTRKFGRTFIVTNQQGIGKGLMSHEDLNGIHQKMRSEIEEAGGYIDQIYYCPGLAVDNPECRKPNTGMAIQAGRDFPAVSFANSVMVGDSKSDMIFAQTLGMVKVWVTTAGEGGHVDLQVDRVVKSLPEFTQLFIQYK